MVSVWSVQTVKQTFFYISADETENQPGALRRTLSF